MAPGEERVLLQVLQSTKNGTSSWAYEVGTLSRSTASMVKSLLLRTLDREFGDEIQLQPDERFRLAFLVASRVGLAETARTLDWKEFERFAEECLSRAGYATERNVRLTDRNKKRWEIDVVANKPPMMLFVDCKHWSHSSPQKLRTALEHQKNAMRRLTRVEHEKLDGPSEIWGLPVVLTLFDSNQAVVDGGVLVSVQKLSDFLEHLTFYDPEIPFVYSSNGQKPIKQPSRSPTQSEETRV